MINITIGGVDKTTSVIQKQLKIRNRINDRADECTFMIKKKTSTPYRPNLNDEVVITNGDIIFGGVIVRVDEVAMKGDLIVYNVQCTDYSHFLTRRLVVQRYEDTTAQAIIANLISVYTSDGFTTNGVSIDKNITSFSFNGLTVSKCLEKLANSLNALWYVDYNKDVHFFYRNTETAPFALTDTSENFIYESLVITEDITKLRNKVTVRGGTNPSTNDRSETLVSADDTQDIFPIGYKFANEPVVTVDGTPVTVGLEYVDDDTLFDAMWSYTQKYVRFTTGNIPTATDVIVATGKIEIPVIVRTPNNGSIAEFGVFEYQIDDDTITTNDEAIERAVAELQSYANELHEGSFETYNSGLRSGQILTINSTKRNKSIKVVLQDVKLKVVDPNGEQVKYTIKFATLKLLGIIEFLQRSLMNEDIIEDATETLLNFIQQPEDVVSFEDGGVQDITITSPPYKYSPVTSGTAGKYGFSSWG